MSSEYSADFAKMQPLCAGIATTHRMDDILKLEGILIDTDDNFIQLFQDYLVFPFRLILLKKSNEKITIKAIDMITYIFNRSSLNDWSTFSNTFMQILSLVCHPTDFDKVSDTSEELKSSVCCCITSILTSSTIEIHKTIYNPSFRLPLAQAFHALILILKHERGKGLRKTVLQTIGVLCYSSRYITDRSQDIEEYASDTLAAFFPGLICALSQVITGDNKQGESVIEMALNIFGDILVLVIGDQCTIASNKFIENVESPAVNVVKDNTWVLEVADKLQILIQKSLILVKQNSWKLHLAYLEFAESVLFRCSRNLEKSIIVLLPAVFSLSINNNKKVSVYSKKLIMKFSEKFKTLNSMSLLSLIEEEIYASASKLIKSKLTANDEETLYILKSVLGYLYVLGCSVDRLLISFPYLERLILSILSLLKFDLSHLRLMEEFSIDVDIISSPVIQKKMFRYFQKEEILITICNICECLGKSTHNRLAIDYLIEKSQSSEFSLESIFLIGCIVKGLSKETCFKDNNIALIGDVIDELLFTSSETELEGICTTTSQIWNGKHYENHNCDSSKLYKICLTLETIEKCAIALGWEFRSFLMKILFYVMQNAGSSNYALSQSGKICLYSIAESCGYNPKVELIRDNADYLVNSITLNFHHFLYRPEAIAILQAILEESDDKMFPLFRDCVDHVLNMLDYNQDKAILLLTVLKSVAIFINKWFPVNKTVKPISSSKAAENDEDLKSYFLNKTQGNKNSQEVDSEEAKDHSLKMKDTTSQNIEKLKTYISQNKDVQKFVDKYGGAGFSPEISKDSEQVSKELGDLLKNNKELGTLITDYSKDSFNMAENSKSNNTFERTEKEVLPLHIALSAEILKRCCHLQSSKSRQLCVLALEVMQLCIIALGDFENQQHPLIHELWNPLIERFSEEHVVVLQAFKVLLLIADEARDFIQVRCMRDVVPKLNALLKNGLASSSTKNYHKYQYSNDYKLHILVLSEIGQLFTKFDFSEKHLSQLIEVCLPYLQNTQSKEFQEAAYKTLKYLAGIDSDAVWFYCNQLYCDITFLSPPHNSLKVLDFPHSASIDNYQFNF